MELKKLLFDIREGLSIISDDRRIDDRYIEHLINVARADFIKKLLSSRPGANTLNLEQDYHAHVASVSRSIFPNLNIKCSILRSVDPIPEMISSDITGQTFRVRTADILKNTIEVVEYERANNLTFEFNVVYAFLDYKKYLYFVSKDNHQELKYAVLSGIFNNPSDVEDDLEEYPLPGYIWNNIKPGILEMLNNRPAEDPINNSEPDYFRQKDDKDDK